MCIIYIYIYIYIVNLKKGTIITTTITIITITVTVTFTIKPTRKRAARDAVSSIMITDEHTINSIIITMNISYNT